MKTYNFTNRVIPPNFIEKVRPSLEVDVKFWAKADKIRGGGGIRFHLMGGGKMVLF